MILNVLKEMLFPSYNLIFQITNKCNFNCLHCFNYAILNKPIVDLTLDEVDKFTETMPEIPVVTLGGGEPFLRDDLVDICKVFETNNNTKSITIPTNGSLLDKMKNDIMRIKSETNISLFVNVSIDGLKETHDRIRQKGSFSNALDALYMLNELSIDYGVNVTISELNQDEIKNIIEFFDDCDIKPFFEILRGNYDSNKIKPPSYEKYKEIVETLKEYNKGSFSAASYYYEKTLITLKEHRQPYPCYAGYRTPAIDNVGNVRLCELLEPIGNLRLCDYDFNKIWASELANVERKKIKEGKCYCTHSCYQIPSIMHSPTTLLKAGLNYLREI